jgi:hypothetical protein
VDCDLEAVVQSFLHPVSQKHVIIAVPPFIVHDCMGASSFNLYLSMMDIYIVVRGFWKTLSIISIEKIKL